MMEQIDYGPLVGESFIILYVSQFIEEDRF